MIDNRGHAPGPDTPSPVLPSSRAGENSSAMAPATFPRTAGNVSSYYHPGHEQFSPMDAGLQPAYPQGHAPLSSFAGIPIAPRSQGETNAPPSSWQSRAHQPYDSLASPSAAAGIQYPGHTQYASAYDQRREAWTAHATALPHDGQRGIEDAGSDGVGPAMVPWSPTGPPLPGQSLASAPAVTFSAANSFPAARPRDHFRTRSYPSMQWQYDQAGMPPDSESPQQYPSSYSYGFPRGQSPAPGRYHRHAGGEGRPADR